MKVRVQWHERATYRVEVDIPDDTDLEDEDAVFEAVDDANPNWFKTNLVEVNDREFEEIEKL